MSPTEFDLRAALRDGEGDGLDPDAVVDRAEAYRRQRRARVLGGLASAAVVAGLAVTGAVALGGNGSSPARTATPGAISAPTRYDKAGAAAPADCPPVFPQLLAPGHVAARPYGASGPLFDSGVTDVVVCDYGPASATAQAPVAVSLHLAMAAELVDSLERAPTTPPRLCPQFLTNDTRRYAVIGRTPDGRQSRTVTVVFSANPCHTTVTNGTAVRYAWTPTPVLATVLPGLGARGVPSTSHS
jgi:hypothetical protein